MKIKIALLSFLIAASQLGATTYDNERRGWGSKQTQGTVKGILIGGTVGGIIGKQKGKTEEGILVGGTVGGILGNQVGKGQDYRREEHARHLQELERQRAAHRQAALDRQNRYRGRPVSNQPRLSNNPIAHGGSNTNMELDPELVDARHRAEQAELELQREMEKKAADLERQRKLEEYRERLRLAQEELLRVRGYDVDAIKARHIQ